MPGPPPSSRRGGRECGAAISETQQQARSAALRDVNQAKAYKARLQAVQAQRMREAGQTLGQIAKMLGASVRTVQRYLASTVKNTFSIDTNPARVLARRLLVVKPQEKTVTAACADVSTIEHLDFDAVVACDFVDGHVTADWKLYQLCGCHVILPGVPRQSRTSDQ